MLTAKQDFSQPAAYIIHATKQDITQPAAYKHTTKQDAYNLLHTCTLQSRISNNLLQTYTTKLDLTHATTYIMHTTKHDFTQPAEHIMHATKQDFSYKLLYLLRPHTT